MKQIIILGTPLAFMVISAIIVKYTYDYRLKNKIIDSIGIDDITIDIFESKTDRFRFIRWGVILITLGLGIYISSLLNYTIYQPVFYCVPCILVGMGLIVSSIIKTK